MTPITRVRHPQRGLVSLEAECRGAKPAGADLDAAKAGRVLRTAARPEAA